MLGLSLFGFIALIFCILIFKAIFKDDFKSDINLQIEDSISNYKKITEIDTSRDSSLERDP